MSKRAGKKYRPITVGELIDVIDYNRDGDECVLISERDDNWQRVFTDSMMLDQISDAIVDSIGADGDVIQIWIADESVVQYWEGLKDETDLMEKDMSTITVSLRQSQRSENRQKEDE